MPKTHVTYQAAHPLWMAAGPFAAIVVAVPLSVALTTSVMKNNLSQELAASKTAQTVAYPAPAGASCEVPSAAAAAPSPAPAQTAPTAHMTSAPMPARTAPAAIPIAPSKQYITNNTYNKNNNNIIDSYNDNSSYWASYFNLQNTVTKVHNTTNAQFDIKDSFNKDSYNQTHKTAQTQNNWLTNSGNTNSGNVTSVKDSGNTTNTQTNVKADNGSVASGSAASNGSQAASGAKAKTDTTTLTNHQTTNTAIEQSGKHNTAKVENAAV